MNITHLQQQFDQDIGSAEQLLELINHEFEALSEHDLPRLQQILTDKLPLLALLEQNGKRRTRLLLDNNFSADHQGLQAAAAQAENGRALIDASEKLNELLEQCKTANLRNGRVIRSNQKSTESMLGILRGNETPSLYDSTGGTAKIGNKRPLSQA